MANIAGKISMKMLTIAVGIPVGIVTKKVVEQTWTTVRPDDPPRKPTQAGAKWGDAIAWGALSAVGVVAADMFTRKGAEGAWRFLIGTEPPPPKTTKGMKKLERAQERVSSDDADATVVSAPTPLP
ncbi:MAG: hypothetical protein QOE97_2947 [Pseudonocardiales bacterium]|jgi:hypothetical protein|nr:hypothetical protein [Pseudonocardiales bacterium]